jgi:hypothetical protein
VIPLLAGPHFAFLADRLGLSLKTIRGVHWFVDDSRTCSPPCHGCGVQWASPTRRHRESVCSCCTLPYHSPLSVPSFCEPKLDRRRRCFAFYSSSCFLSSASSRTSSSSGRTKPSPRLHIYTVWRHVPSNRSSPRVYIYISMVVFAFTSLLQISAVIV